MNEQNEFALIGICTICGTVNAISFTCSQVAEKDLRAQNREIKKVSRIAAQALVKDLARCDHKKLITELRSKIEYLENEIDALLWDN